MKADTLVSPLLLLGTMSSAYLIPAQVQHPLGQPPHHESPSSRRIVVRESSKSISGSYPLYDLLSIYTGSGSISVSVAPHSASSKDPSQPASLELKSNSGSVHATLLEALAELDLGADGPASSDSPPPPYSAAINYDDDAGYGSGADGRHVLEEKCTEKSPCNPSTRSGFPSREYSTTVSTRSGSISGSFPLGTFTELDTGSGSLSNVELFVMPVNASSPRRLRTVSPSGSQSIRIVDDNLWRVAGEEEAWWEGMVSRHESLSGSISVEYPDSWEGTIEVETGAGSINIRGKGVQIIRQGEGRVIARKGKEGGGKVIVRVKSGSVDLRFG